MATATATRKPTEAQARYLVHAIENNESVLGYLPGQRNRQFFQVVDRMRDAGWVEPDSLRVTTEGREAVAPILAARTKAAEKAALLAELRADPEISAEAARLRNCGVRRPWIMAKGNVEADRARDAARVEPTSDETAPAEVETTAETNATWLPTTYIDQPDGTVAVTVWHNAHQAQEVNMTAGQADILRTTGTVEVQQGRWMTTVVDIRIEETAANAPESGEEIIDAHTRVDALADGTLVDVTGTARRAGIRYPVALTRTVWEGCVAWEDADNERKDTLQDQAGRLWDVLWMARCAMGRATGARVEFSLLRVPRAGKGRRPVKVHLAMVVGPGDDREPVITIGEPGED